LNSNVEHLGFLVIKTQQGTREDEVAGLVVLSTLMSLALLPWFLATVM
jgi:predicted permease